MKLIVRDLHDKIETGNEMYRLIEEFSDDLKGTFVYLDNTKVPFLDLSLVEAFDVIKDIPYKQDEAPVEVVARPAYINNNTGADCKKKAILMSSYLKQKGIDYRLVAVSTSPDRRIHHVFTQGLIDGQWLNLDPTYSNCKPFEEKTVTKFEVL